MQQANIRVLIVDDHFVVRQGILALLAGSEDIEVVGEAENGVDAVRLSEELEPDTILMDLIMPEMDGVEAIRSILQQRPETCIVVMTGTNVDHRALEAVRAGALGFLAKTATREEVLTAIRRVQRGEHSLPADLTRALLRRVEDPNAGRLEVDPLTRREHQILRLLARGMSNQGIANEIHIAEVTVRTHVSKILAKLGVSNRVEAALYALRHGLADLDPE